MKKKEKSSTETKDAAETTSTAGTYREQKPRTKVTVGKFPFKVDISALTVKTVGRAQATVKGSPYISGRVSLPREWIGKQVLIMQIDEEEETNRKSINALQNEE